MIPNIISISRIFLLLPILFFLYDNQNLVAFFIFIVGCFTDFLDGFIARLFNQESLLGENLDLLADKIFVSTLFMYIPFHFDNFIFLLGGIIIIIRELVITSMRQYFLAKKNSFKVSVNFFGKSKTMIQMITLGMSLILLGGSYEHVAEIFLFLSIFFSWASLINYANVR